MSSNKKAKDQSLNAIENPWRKDSHKAQPSAALCSSFSLMAYMKYPILARAKLKRALATITA